MAYWKWSKVVKSGQSEKAKKWSIGQAVYSLTTLTNCPDVSACVLRSRGGEEGKANCKTKEKPRLRRGFSG
jgi:hypothetical protein